MKWPPPPPPLPPQPASGPPDAPPDSYAAALAWLEKLGGAHVTSPRDDGSVLVSVGVLGRSAEVVAASPDATRIERALVDAVAALHAKL